MDLLFSSLPKHRLEFTCMWFLRIRGSFSLVQSQYRDGSVVFACVCWFSILCLRIFRASKTMVSPSISSRDRMMVSRETQSSKSVNGMLKNNFRFLLSMLQFVSMNPCYRLPWSPFVRCLGKEGWVKGLKKNISKDIYYFFF